MQKQEQHRVRAFTSKANARRANIATGASRLIAASQAPVALGLVALACGGSTQLVVPAALRSGADRVEVETLSVTAPTQTIGNCQITFLQSPDRGKEVLSSGMTVSRWALSVTGPGGQVALDCEAQYGAPTPSSHGAPSTTSVRCNGRGTPATLELSGPGQRQGEGKLVLSGVEYSIEPVNEVEGGQAPTRPAGYTIRRSFDVEAAAESIGPDDPGAIYISRKTEEPRRTALMAVSTALIELGVLAPKGSGAAGSE